MTTTFGPEMPSKRARGYWLAVAAFALAVATVGGFVFVVNVLPEMAIGTDAGDEVVHSPNSDLEPPDEPAWPEDEAADRSASDWLWDLGLLGVLVVATGAPVVARNRTPAIITRAIATVLLLGLSLLTIFSLIVGFLPAAAMMAIAMLLAISESRADDSGKIPEGGQPDPPPV